LELQFLPGPGALMLNVEYRLRWNAKSFAGNLDGECLLRLDRIR